ncbi:hypothetical protein Hdeb2414_s0004g00143451 [Helianthus debilis subsp. tardiflorus]
MSSGLKVDFGFGSYSERMNGRVAVLGLVIYQFTSHECVRIVFGFSLLPH